MKNEIRVKGFFRLQIVDKKGKIVGDSGRIRNVITNYGWNNCIVPAPLGVAAEVAAFAALGSTAAEVASDASNVLGNVCSATDGTKRFVALTTTAIMSSKTNRVTAAYDGSANSGNVSRAIQQIGLFVATNPGSMICGQSFASSVLATNQTCNITYDFNFAAA